MYEGKRQLALFCVEKRGKLLHLRRYLNQPELMENEWAVVEKYMLAHKDDQEICRHAITVANEFYSGIRRYGINARQCTENLVMKLEDIFSTQPLDEVAGMLALATANLYMLCVKDDGKHCDSLFEKIKSYLNAFPRSKQVRSAYATVCAEKYTNGLNRVRDVPLKIMRRIKQWYNQYPGEIEFRESYFQLLFVHMEYAQTQGMKAEEKRTFHEMEQLAKGANYDEYLEENKLQRVIELLRRLHHY